MTNRSIIVTISGSRHPPHPFFTYLLQGDPNTSPGSTASFVEQEAARSLTFKAEEKLSDLPGAPAFLRSTTSRQHWLRHPRAREESTWAR